MAEGFLDMAVVVILLWIASDLFQLADTKSNPNPVKHRVELRLLALAATGFSFSAVVGHLGLETGIPTWLGLSTALFVASLFFHTMYSQARKVSLILSATLLVTINIVRWY